MFRLCQALSGFSAYRPRILLFWLVYLVWLVYNMYPLFSIFLYFPIAGWRSRPSTLTTSPTSTTHGRPSQPPSTPSASMSSPRDSSINRIGQILSTVGWAAQDLRLGLGLCSGMGSMSSLTLRPWGGSLKFGTLPVTDSLYEYISTWKCNSWKIHIHNIFALFFLYMLIGS